MDRAPSRGKRLMLVGGALLVAGAAPWAYWIGLSIDGGRGAIPSTPLTALAILAILGGLATTVVGLVSLLRARSGRRRDSR